MSDSRPDSRSWAELVRTIDRERKSLPWDPTKTEPVQRASMYERKKAEREYDLISSSYRNPVKQEMTITMKHNKELSKLAQVKELKESTFNIVSHQGPPRKIESMLAAQKTKGVPPRPYNFVTNLSVEDHQNAPLLFDEDYTNARAGKPKENRSAVGKHTREFSIINNDYYQNNETKKKAEYDRFKNHTLNKYWATHDYDPVRGKFYDAEKEERYREQRQLLSTVHGMAKSLRVAPSIQYSDGNCYDIVNHTIHDDEKCSVSDAVAERSLHRIKRGGIEKQARERGEEEAIVAERKRLARISFKRWEETVDRGFDFIKNSVTTIDQPQPLPPRPASMWARLQNTADLNHNNEPKMGLSGANTRGNTASSGQSTRRVRNLTGEGPAVRELQVNLNSSSDNLQAVSSSPFPSPGLRLHAGNTGRGGGSRSPQPPVSASEYYAQANNNYSTNPNTNPNTAGRLKPLTAVGSRQGGDAGIASASSRGLSNVANSEENGGGGRAVTAGAGPPATRQGSRGRTAPAPAIVPSLDLTKAEAPEPVRYVEPANGPMGMSVQMVRTGGGLSGYRE